MTFIVRTSLNDARRDPAATSTHSCMANQAISKVLESVTEMKVS